MATRLARSLSYFRPCSATLRASTSSIRRLASTFQTGPSPPRLPPDEQAEFERLQRIANTQAGFTATSSPDFSTSNPPSESTQQLSPSSTNTSPATSSSPAAATPKEDNTDASLDGAVSTPLRKGAPPEFEGDVNPRTGEVGGPKNEPLRWGAGGDYSYNGRVTDF
ncbi:hypothetical protein O1611_g5501 [Lasiodiplodia mahajangana]|uniref:Uncharacterized protein n=1 Tax=Lasiodiplodia mahajangana TaxID=1108764 RepID=A0ACC2JKU2_9PEZI|nr:hypothetical protein O1611_g5501 [Lasiodiplodia mahajangana]